jgi:flagellar biosynthesis/type III secretory pathway protein FliH
MEISVIRVICGLLFYINQGHNGPLIRRCKTLEGYSAFVARAREYEGQGKLRGEAVKEAVKDCIRQNILKDFLEIHSKEVINMLMTEWNWDDALAVQREEGREEGLERGREEAAAEYAEQIRQMREEIRRLRGE